MTPNNEESDLVRLAREVATHAHEGLLDKAGRPYITHPQRVAATVADHGDEYVAAAWLHDVIEDTDITADDLRAEGFPEGVVTAILALTKHQGEQHADAVARACADPIAKVVKAADVLDNSDPNRLALIREPKRGELTDKYELARRVLDEHGAPQFQRLG